MVNAKSEIAAPLLGHWPLSGDSRDHSGNENHGQATGVDLAAGRFSGHGSGIAVPAGPSLRLGKSDFTAAAWVRAEAEVTGPVGDVLNQFEPNSRTGFTLAIKASAGGYNSHGDDKHLYFGIDQGRLGEWRDEGRPSLYSNYVSNSLTVFDGYLYAATTDAVLPENWCHVFRSLGDGNWEDCGRVGSLKTHGVGPLAVHRGSLYAGTWSYDWTRLAKADVDFGHTYRYAGGQEWEDCGQPGENKRLVCLASFKGRLYAGGDDSTAGSFKVFVYEGNGKWAVAARFPMEGPLACFPHPMGVHDDRLYVSGIVPTAAMRPAVHAFDGNTWQFCGNPVDSNQVHSLEVYRGDLYAGTWPEGKVGRYAGEQSWDDCGRLGDSTEVNGLCVYNGKFYAGSIPRGEVYRYEGGQAWTRLARFYSPEGWAPIQVDNVHIPGHEERVKEWTRVTSLTAFQGRLFASIASCTAAVQDAPLDVRGKVYSIEAGRNTSYDGDVGNDWHHLAAVRRGDRLELYVDGKLASASAPFAPDDYDLNAEVPLQIGAGELAPFRGWLRDVRLYGAALSEAELVAVAKVARPGEA